MGVVYYANYFAWFERGRCEYMRERGFDYGAFEQAGFILPVSEAHAQYRMPARFDDLVAIEAEITAVSRVTATFSYRISRGADELCKGSTVHACLTKAGRPVRWPDAVRALFPSNLLPAAGLAAKSGPGDST